MDAGLRRLSRGGGSSGACWPTRAALLLLLLLRRQRQVGSASGSPAPALLLLLLLLLQAPGGTPATTSETTIDGRALSVSSLREAESRSFTCLAAAPSLAWYLNGELQETNVSSRLLATAGRGGGGGGGDSSSTFVVTARRLDRRLDCTAINPATGRGSTASVLLNVQFKPDVVKVDARFREASEPGVLLVLFVLVQANPPAEITWLDPDGQLTVNSSSFLLLDAETFPWLANHTVRVQLRGPARNLSLSASNDLGIANSSVLLSGLLDTQIELPLVALVGAAALALVMLLGFGVLISRTAKRPVGVVPSAQLPARALERRVCKEREETQLLRESLSLPPNLWLNDLDLAQEPESERQGLPFLASAQKAEQMPQGWDRLPPAGYIYRASSRSSEEIWL